MCVGLVYFYDNAVIISIMNMNKMKRLGGSLLIIWVILTQAVGAGTLERLFTRAEDREELNKLRATPPPTQEELKTQLLKPPPVITFNGIVTRSDGRTTVWVNGSEELIRPTFSVVLEKQTRSAVPIVLSSAGQEIWLKPGQTVTTLDGKIFEGYESQLTHSQATTVVTNPLKEVESKRK